MWSAVTRHRFGEATGRRRMTWQARTRGHATAGASRERPFAWARPRQLDGDESPWESGDESPHSKGGRTRPWRSGAVVGRLRPRATRPYHGRARVSSPRRSGRIIRNPAVETTKHTKDTKGEGVPASCRFIQQVRILGTEKAKSQPLFSRVSRVSWFISSAVFGLKDILPMCLLCRPVLWRFHRHPKIPALPSTGCWRQHLRNGVRSAPLGLGSRVTRR